MIYRFMGHLSNEMFDLMDSAVRASVKTVFSGDPESIQDYVVDGKGLRSPVGDSRQTNPSNVTKDQLVCLLAACYKLGRTDLSRNLLIQSLKRGFFAQNTDRDVPGSQKYPWPHYVREDDGTMKLRLFDWADPMQWPHIIGAYLVAAGAPALGHLIGGWFLALIIVGERFLPSKEHNQLQCLLSIYGPAYIRLYTRVVPQWRSTTRLYWDSRNEPEYAEWIIEALSP